MKIIKYGTLLDGDRKCRIMKEEVLEYGKCEKFTKPQQIFEMLCSVFSRQKKTEEYRYLLCMNTRGRMIGVFEVSHGIVDGTICGNREIFQRALLCNATQIILAHNHPSGDPTPSKEDICVFKRIVEAGCLMNIYVTDNIIVGDGTMFSFVEENLHPGNEGKVT